MKWKILSVALAVGISMFMIVFAETSVSTHVQQTSATWNKTLGQANGQKLPVALK